MLEHSALQLPCTDELILPKFQGRNSCHLSHFLPNFHINFYKQILIPFISSSSFIFLKWSKGHWVSAYQYVHGQTSRPEFWSPGLTVEGENQLLRSALCSPHHNGACVSLHKHTYTYTNNNEVIQYINVFHLK